MIKYVSGCVDCGQPCRGSACRHYEEAVACCDECGEDEKPVYEYDNKHMCIKCIEESLTRVEA